MFEPVSKTWHIFRLDRSTQKWVDTGTRVDDRPQTLSDALWDGQKLYVASQWATVSSDSSVRTSVSGRPARLYRYSYNASSKTYTLDPGFPSNINNYSSESLTIDKDSTGRLWATWTQVSGSSTAGYTSKVYINSSQDGGSWERRSSFRSPGAAWPRTTSPVWSPSPATGSVCCGATSATTPCTGRCTTTATP